MKQGAVILGIDEAQKILGTDLIFLCDVERRLHWDFPDAAWSIGRTIEYFTGPAFAEMCAIFEADQPCTGQKFWLEEGLAPVYVSIPFMGRVLTCIPDDRLIRLQPTARELVMGFALFIRYTGRRFAENQEFLSSSLGDNNELVVVGNYAGIITIRCLLQDQPLANIVLLREIGD